MSTVRRTLRFAGMLMVLFTARSATATTCTWIGTSGSEWSTGTNWQCLAGSSPPGLDDTAIFNAPDAGGGVGVYVGEGQAIGSIEINADNYTFENGGGGSLTIDALSANASVHFSVPVSVAISSSWTAASGATVNFGVGSGVALTFASGSPITLTTEGAGAFAFDGLVTGPGTIVAMGPGNVALQVANNTYDGGTEVYAGTLLGEASGVFGEGPVFLYGDAAVSISSPGTFPNSLVLDTVAVPSFTTDVALTWSGTVELVAPTEILNDGTDLVFSGPITSSAVGATLTLAANGSIELSNANNTYDGGTIVSADDSESNYGAISEYGTSLGLGPITIVTSNEAAGAIELAAGVNLSNPIWVSGDGPGGLGAIYAVGDASISSAITGVAYGIGAADGATLELTGTLGGGDASVPPGLQKLGAGTVVLDLSSSATYVGPTWIASGTLDLGPAADTLPEHTDVQFYGVTGMLAVHANTSIGSLQSEYSGSSVRIDEGATLTIANDVENLAYYSGTIIGDGGVNFVSDANVVFTATQNGSSSYDYLGPTLLSGNTEIGPNTLILSDGTEASGSIPNSTITVTSGGVLDLGAASIMGPIVGAGGNIVPYGGAATSVDAGAASLTLEEGTKFTVGYYGPDSGSTSYLAVHGPISLGDASLAVTSTETALQGPVVIVSNQGDAAVTGTFAGLPEGETFAASTGSGVLKISYVGGAGHDITLEVALFVDAGIDSAMPDSGAPVDAGADSEIMVDSGTDAEADATLPDATPDAESDAETHVDAESDAAEKDAAISFDASLLDGSISYDAAVHLDAAIFADSGISEDAGIIPILAGPQGKSCSCETVGGDASSNGAFLAFGAVVLMGVRRRRRSS